MTALTIYEIRRTNLQALVHEHGDRNTLANKIGRDRNQIDQLLTSKNMGSKLARDIERPLGLSYGWLDHPQTTEMREEIAAYRGGGVKSVENKKRAAWGRLFYELEKEGKSDAALRLLRHLASELRRGNGPQESHGTPAKKRAR